MVHIRFMAWAISDTLTAAEVARRLDELPEAERAAWQRSAGICIGCSARPPTRLDPSASDAERVGVGFFTCRPCRDYVQTHGFERPGWVGPSSFPPNAKRDAGLCSSCVRSTADLRAAGSWTGNAARANAELAGTTVARMATATRCAKCNPAKRPKCSRCRSRMPSGTATKWCDTCRDRHRLRRYERADGGNEMVQRGRPTEGAAAMTSTERSRRRRERLAKEAPGVGMTQKQRRRRGLCIDCGAPAAPNKTLPSARALAISEGRGLTSDVHLRGLPVVQLTTWRRCEQCNEKRNKCPVCKTDWKEFGRTRCRQCLRATRA